MSTLRTESVACGDAGSMDMHVWTPEGAAEPRPAVLLIQEIFGVGPYIRAGALIPSRSRDNSSCRSTTEARARREALVASSGAVSTGQAV